MPRPKCLGMLTLALNAEMLMSCEFYLSNNVNFFHWRGSMQINKVVTS